MFRPRISSNKTAKESLPLKILSTLTLAHRKLDSALIQLTTTSTQQENQYLNWNCFHFACQRKSPKTSSLCQQERTAQSNKILLQMTFYIVQAPKPFRIKRIRSFEILANAQR